VDRPDAVGRSRRSRLGTALFWFVGGALHWVVRREYESYVPPPFTRWRREIVVASGVAEIAGDGFVLRFVPTDFVQGLVKPFVFGGIISITACYFGINTTGGTEGVGQSTTRTVVLSSILILVVDYFLTQILLSVLGS